MFLVVCIIYCFELLKGSVCPKYSDKIKIEYDEQVSIGNLEPGYGIPEGSIAHFTDGIYRTDISTKANETISGRSCVVHVL